MIKKKSWKEFQDSGFLWWINMILHTFGWAIVLEFDEKGKIQDVYPARCDYRGFSEETNSKGYIKVSKYMVDNAENLLEEAKDN